jgi:hypothetical protein
MVFFEAARAFLARRADCLNQKCGLQYFFIYISSGGEGQKYYLLALEI